jgi:pyruvate formate lyase activating enzyme
MAASGSRIADTQEKDLMRSGWVFDIREFAVHDGPGIRTTVFMKGCPLACTWCHNPEGRSLYPQQMRGQAGDRLVGREYTAAELAKILNRQADILRANEGGVTFSGGEPLMQAEFVAEVCDLLSSVHIVLDTSGFASEAAFRLVSEKCSLIFFDLKIIDPQIHRRYTGVDNAPILANLAALRTMEVPFHIRVPLVPGVTDTDENLAAIAQLVQSMPRLVRVDLLPYNKAAGAKYPGLGMEFRPLYDENQDVNVNTQPFEKLGLSVCVAGTDSRLPRGCTETLA